MAVNQNQAYIPPKPLYGRHPRAVAQVSRTAKWLVNALASLRRILRPPAPE